MKQVGLTHLDKVYWPKEKYTKGDMIAYYEKVATRMLPYLKGRPVTMVRYPDGIKGVHFYQKDVEPRDMPPFVTVATLPSGNEEGKVDYVVCNNKKTLLYLANLGCIELHIWNSRVKARHKPDYLVFDLDPGAGVTFDDVIALARIVKDLLASLGCKSFVKTSGKHGLHIYVPLGAKYSTHEAKEFAKCIAHHLAAMYPKQVVARSGKSHRRGKIFIDYLRNEEGQTTVAPYSLRAVAGAPVSVPLPWSAVKKGLQPEKFTMKSMLHSGDPLHSILGKGVNLAVAAEKLARLESILSTSRSRKGV